MSTKNDKYSFIEQSFTTSENQYYSLNLNQSKKGSILVPVQSYIKSNNNNKFCGKKIVAAVQRKNINFWLAIFLTAVTNYIVSDNYEKKEKLQLWNKSFKTSTFTTFNENNDDLKKQWKNETTLKTINNKSTISLQISAYENSTETDASDLFNNENNEGLTGSIKTFKHCFIDSLKSFNPFEFEFPRQQNGNQRNEPEIMQFKASQKLLGSQSPKLSQQNENNGGQFIQPQKSADTGTANYRKMSSSDDSSSSSSDEAPPRNDRPSSHSGISDEEPSSPPPPAAAAKASTLPTKKASKKSVTPSSSSSSENEEEKTPKKAKSRSKSSTPSSRSNSEAPTKRAAPVKSTDTMGSLSPDSSIAPEERHATPKMDNNEESNIVPDLSDSDADDEQRKKAKPISSPKETNEDSDDDIVGPRLHFDPDDVEEEKEVEQPPIEYDVPLVRGNYGKEPPVLTRWPNFISVDRRPFTEDSYDPEEDINAVDSEGRSRLQLKVENCIRWRNKLDADGNIMKDEDGKEIRESNAKIVRWSDGTMTLNLGAEIYEITEHKIEEYNQLFLRMRAGLHGNAAFKKRFAFRPLTTDSMTHRKMTMQMAEKTNKSQKVKMISEVGLDPESSRASLIRKEEERMRASMRREAQQRKAKERQYRTGLSHGFLEDRDDFDDDPESLSAIKRSYKNNRFDRFDAITRRYGQSEDEDEYEDSRRIERSKIESDDEEDANRKREEKKKRKIVISDEDED